MRLTLMPFLLLPRVVVDCECEASWHGLAQPGCDGSSIAGAQRFWKLILFLVSLRPLRRRQVERLPVPFVHGIALLFERRTERPEGVVDDVHAERIDEHRSHGKQCPQDEEDREHWDGRKPTARGRECKVAESNVKEHERLDAQVVTWSLGIGLRLGLGLGFS